MSSPLLTLRQVNGKFRNAFLRFQPELQHCSAIAPDEFSGLRAELSRARNCLRELEGVPVPPGQLQEVRDALADEMCQYRSNLEKLKHILPSVQLRLLVERSRLQQAQSHVVAATAWAGANKKSLRK